MCLVFLLALSRVRQGACPESPNQTGSLSWVTISKAESHLSPGVRTWLVGSALQIQEATLSTEARPSLTKKTSEGINHGLKRHCPYKACGGTLGLSDQLLEKEALEKVIKIKRNALPPLQFHLNHWQDIHENPVGPEGQGDLECEFSAQQFTGMLFTHHHQFWVPPVSQSDSNRNWFGEFHPQIKFTGSNIEAQWLYLTASKATRGFEVWPVKD